MADFIDFFVLYNILLYKKLHQFLIKKNGQFELLVFFFANFLFSVDKYIEKSVFLDVGKYSQKPFVSTPNE